jgi:solute carrier family 13 (sodium-dependent dicarboxylate transporter), member 2/3/5
VQMLDSKGQVVPISIDAITSVIRGPQYEQLLPSTGTLGAWNLFSLRVPFKAQVTMGLLVAIAILWVTELVPLAATAILIPVVAVLAHVTDVTTVLQPFANPIIALFLAGFLLADAMRRSGLDRRLAFLILSRTNHNPLILMLSLMGITSFLCLWMSNTASASLMVPITLAVLARIPAQTLPKGYPRALLLAVGYSATVGGVGSALGTPPNIMAMTFLNQYTGGELTFVNWFAYGLPFVLLMLPIIWLYLLVSFRVDPRRVSANVGSGVYTDDLAKLGPLGAQQKLLVTVYAIIIGFWLTETWHHVPPAIIGLAGVFVLFFTRLIRPEDLNQVNWNALLTFGGGMAIGTLLVDTGVSDWIALQLVGLSALPSSLVIVLVAGVTVLIGAFISNTACAAMLIPIALPLAQMLGLDPRLIVTMIAISCSVDFALVTGTPPTMIVYSTGMFTAGEIFRRGLVVDLIGSLLLSLGIVWIWRWLGIVYF